MRICFNSMATPKGLLAILDARKNGRKEAYYQVVFRVLRNESRLKREVASLKRRLAAAEARLVAGGASLLAQSGQAPVEA